MRSIRPILLAATLALALSVTAGACGGSDDKTITRTQLDTRGNKICKDSDRDVQKAVKKINLTNDTAMVKVIKDIVVPVYRDRVKKLRDLGYPEKDKDRLKKAYDNADKILDGIDDNPKKFVGQNVKDPFIDVEKTFKAVGLTDCMSS